jgi:hypothetical protein
MARPIPPGPRPQSFPSINHPKPPVPNLPPRFNPSTLQPFNVPNLPPSAPPRLSAPLIPRSALRFNASTFVTLPRPKPPFCFPPWSNPIFHHPPSILDPRFSLAPPAPPACPLTPNPSPPANVDDPATLAALLDAIQRGTRGLPVVFPIHPRTRKVLTAINYQPLAFNFCDPLGYLEFNYLVQHAKAVITASGGITEETTVLGVPCLTLRDNTERPETVTHGTNELIGTDPARLGPALDRLFAGQWKRGAIPDKWDGHTGDRIIAELERCLCSQAWSGRTSCW